MISESADVQFTGVPKLSSHAALQNNNDVKFTLYDEKSMRIAHALRFSSKHAV